jgi:predicted nuclease of predicted toxin-antitoxin system
MIPRFAKILADENIQADVVAFLRAEGFDVAVAKEILPEGTSDAEILRRAFDERRIVLTHDRDFSTLAIAGQHQTFVILYIRPGHIQASFTTETLRSLLTLEEISLETPCIIVAERSGGVVKIRVRRW